MSRENASETQSTACDWLARRDAGDMTPQEQAGFQSWLEDSPLNRVAFLRAEYAWEQSSRLKALGAGAPADAVPEPGHWAHSPFFDRDRETTRAQSGDGPAMAAAGAVIPAATRGSRSLPLRWVAGLAAAALLVVAGHYAIDGGLLRRDRYFTPVGGMATVPMPDGSNVTLNTDSEIRVVVTQSERRVSLDHGEAFFEVAKDPARPFVVVAGDKRVIVVGTKFSVRRGPDDIRVVVTEGKVRVAAGGDAAQSVAQPVPAGAVARVSDAGVMVQPSPPAEADDYLSWRRGVLVFRDVTLGEAVAEFNRYNRRKVLIESPQVAQMHIAGSFRATQVEAFVRLLERGYPLRAERADDRILLTLR